LIGFLIFFMVIYFVAVEFNSSTSNTAEVLVFQRGHVPAYLQQNGKETRSDEESTGTADAKDSADDGDVGAVQPQKDIFTWRDVTYDIQIKGEGRRLLDHVAGYVKPGTLTALMGVSGAGKTTLLDVLAQRTSMGVVTGDMFVNGKPLDASFQRSTGYVQQQGKSTPCGFAVLWLKFHRSPPRDCHCSRKSSLQRHVAPAQDRLEAGKGRVCRRGYQDAQHGRLCQRRCRSARRRTECGAAQAFDYWRGARCEAKAVTLPRRAYQWSRLSGTSSHSLGVYNTNSQQSSWAICAFLRKLADAGQAVLCTIHQPSAILFQEFDRLLFLAKGGRTVYFGDIGKNSRTLLEYFESSGARKCGDEENPAEYMLEIVNQGRNDQGEDWHEVWKKSKLHDVVNRDIDQLHREKEGEAVAGAGEEGAHDEFAMPFGTQLAEVTKRVFQQYWRMPSYISAKFILGIAAGLFIGFTFYGADSTQAGMQNVMFAAFMLTTIFTTLVQQVSQQEI
jgi:ATP-binding cassette subfamily G (WHITE) protein 2 (PDR)